MATESAIGKQFDFDGLEKIFKTHFCCKFDPHRSCSSFFYFSFFSHRLIVNTSFELERKARLIKPTDLFDTELTLLRNIVL